MTILQTKFYAISVVIENITASAHSTYYAHITPSYLYLGLFTARVVPRNEPLVLLLTSRY